MTTFVVDLRCDYQQRLWDGPLYKSWQTQVRVAAETLEEAIEVAKKYVLELLSSYFQHTFEILSTTKDKLLLVHS